MAILSEQFSVGHSENIPHEQALPTVWIPADHARSRRGRQKRHETRVLRSLFITARDGLPMGEGSRVPLELRALVQV
ncbi:MAG: hypothetical protein ACREXU_02625 [Gammaproteobacteria bacterium]